MRERYRLIEYCPRCGAKYGAHAFDAGSVAFRCEPCGFDLYQNSVPSATAVVPHACDPRKVLLLTRRTPPARDQLALPGGILRYGEDPARGAAREAYEETTLRVTTERLLWTGLVDYEYDGASVSVLEIAFLMRPISFDPHRVETEEASRLAFYSVDDVIESSALAFPEQALPLAAYRRLLDPPPPAIETAHKELRC